MSDAPSGKLKEQDLTNLDITKLTPSSPQVISRQATINIGTIGHVAHGKSTIVKAVSGVQTVRFKNELERNITIKLDSANENPQSASNAKTSKEREMSEYNIGRSKSDKGFINSEQNLDMIDAALLNCEISLKKKDDVDSTKLLHKKKLIPKRGTSSNHDIFSASSINSSLKLNNKSNENMNSLETNANELESPDVNEFSAAYLTFPTMDESIDKFITSNMMIKSFISGVKMINLIKEKKVVDAYDPKEIDTIVDDAIIHGVHFYLVRWKYWSRGFSTWEQFGSLYNCQLLILNYMREKGKKNKNKDLCKNVDSLHLLLSKRTISRLFDCFRVETGICLPRVNVDDLVSLLHGFDTDSNLIMSSKSVRINRGKTLIMNLRTTALGHFRQKQLAELLEYQKEINIITELSMITQTLGKIQVENNVDLEGPPNVFIYSTKCVPTNVSPTHVPAINNPPIGCTCSRNCNDRDYCCFDMAGYPMAYNANKCVVVPPGSPIFECNIRCKCSQKCRNRVVQLGSKIDVCIYKTRNLCGWGVKTKQNIMKGQFVAEYVGEIITIEKGEERLENKYSSLDHMWNLDFNDANDYMYIVDGSHYSNYTYFINHSCNANLNVYAVWINCLDMNLPHLALFANRDIIAGEQLTIDYFARSTKESLKKTGTKCKCNMKNCKGYFF